MTDLSLPKRRRATIVTVAQEAGVSPSTVSRALSGNLRISAEMRARIARIAKDIGYTPHASGRAMSSGRSGLIGIVIGSVANPFYSGLFQEMVRQAADRNMRLLTIHAGSGPIEDKTADALLQYQVDGCLFTSAELPSNVGKICSANGVPVVMVNRVAKLRTSAVSCDNLSGSAQLADLLVEQGSRRIALVRTSSSSSTGQERERGFVQRIAQRGRELVLRLDGHSTYEGGFQAGKHIAAMYPAKRPDAIFAVSDIMAFGVLDALRLAGIHSGSEVAVVGFDGIPQAGWPIYNLTTVEQPLTTMVARAFDLLQARMTEPNIPDETVVLRGRLISRASSDRQRSTAT